MGTFQSLKLGTVLKLATAASALCIVSGCASSMSKGDCEKVDYYKMGIDHGADGKNSDEYNKVAGKCSAMGSTPNEQNYNNGRQVGLAKYCTESRGSSDGKKGQANGVCMEVPPYKAAYAARLNDRKEEEAKKLRDLEAAAAKNQKAQEKTRTELNKIEEVQKGAPTN